MTYSSTRKKFLYFYVNGKLHKMISVVRARDEATAFCYSEKKIRVYQWSFIQKNAQRAFSMGQVAEMVNRTKRLLQYYLQRGLIERPEKTYALSTGRPVKMMFSEDDVYKIRDIIASMHTGRPRKDGVIKPKNVISKQELYAKMKYDQTLYMKNAKGEFVPLYMSEEW